MKTKSKQKNIPEGWERKRLDEVASFFNGKGHEKDIDENGEYVVVNSKFISTNGRVRKYSNEYLVPLETGDVTMVMSDVPNGKAIAKCFFVDKNNKYTLNQRIGGFKSRKVLDRFLLLVINRNRYFLSFDDGVNQTNLRKDDILACPLVLPPLPEQNRIVSVLETWDSGIEKLKQKIVIKKEIKKGLMQELLTGKKRLPGFSAEFKNVDLNSIVSISTGKKDVNEGNPAGEYPFFTCAREHTFSDNYSYDKEAILIAGNADVGHCKYYSGKFEVYQRTYILSEFHDDVDSMYLFLYMSFFFKNYVESLKQIGAMSYIKLPMLKNFQLKIPALEEQKEVASILTTSDNEIDLFEKKLEYWQEQKKYLLNNLVTGQIRTPEKLSELITR